MSRLESVANLNYVPIPPEVMALIATYLHPAPAGARLLDPCAGEGDAAGQLAAAIGIPPASRFLTELHPARVSACRRHAPHANVLQGDTLADLQVSRSFCQLLYLNPPFSWVGTEQGGERLELRFFQRAVEQGRWLQPGGVAIYVCPERVVRRPTVVRHLARCFDQVLLCQHPAAHRHFREVVVLAVRRETDHSGADLEAAITRLDATVLGTDFPVLTAQLTASYHVPAPMPLPASVLFRMADQPDPMTAARDVAQTGGAWVSPRATAAATAMHQRPQAARPLFARSTTQAALQIADGAINNQVITAAGQDYLIKGSTMEAVHEVETVDADGRSVRTRRISYDPTIALIHTATGQIRQYIGSDAVRQLLDAPELADALVAALDACAPPRYGMQLPAVLRPLLARLVPQSGRALPGQPPGLAAMQQHLVAGLWTAMQPGNDGTTQAQRKLLFGAAMGCGKSVMGAALAELLRCTERLPTDRAYTVILPAPNTLIGQRGQFSPLPQWWAEVADLLPHWYLEILESPAQAARFFRHAQEQPERPHLGFIGFSHASLGSGWTVATHCRRPLPPLQTGSDDAPAAEAGAAQQQYASLLLAGEQADRQQRQAHARATDTPQAQRIHHPNGDGPTREQAPLLGTGVSPRTIRRDQLLRAGTYGRTAPLDTWGRHACPDCGRPVADPHRDDGITACPACGARLGQLDRQFDATADRGLRAFRSLDAHERATVRDPAGRERRAIPWGERPRANPRYPLASLIARRWAHLVDLAIVDEIHEAAARDSAIAVSIGQLIQRCQTVLAMSGTPGNGYADSLYWLSKRLGLTVADAYGWDEIARWSRDMGVVEEIERERATTSQAQVLRGNTVTTYTTVRNRPGITARLAARLASSSICISLESMGFPMPPFDEQLVPLAMPQAVARAYEELEEAGKGILNDADGAGFDALGSYLHSLLCWPLAPWCPRPISSQRTGGAYTPKALDRDLILPHHEWLVETLAPQLYERRRTIVFVQHMRSVGLIEDCTRKVTQLLKERHGLTLRASTLRSTTCASGLRGAWFAGQEARGTQLVFTHPRLVGVGMNLVGWPNLFFLEIPYQLIQALQARRRSWRPTQTKEVWVRWLGYEETLIAQALDLVGRKATSSGLLMGDDMLGGGLYVADDQLSILQALAERVRSGSRRPDMASVAQHLHQAGRTLTAHTRAAALAFDPTATVRPRWEPDARFDPTSDAATTFPRVPRRGGEADAGQLTMF